ncbi:DegT/DnrJ/EryC1/StrS family aminotransferase [Terrimonas alba]|uniref:DegT/DnrJ/EryC1/StrS family aminotransferase n=1 Tax=Terrimonas alba TaxID=3349636 RepID=UPI0035F4AC26
MIYVTKTYLPEFEKYTSILKKSWDKAWITNNGELVQELEHRLKDYLGVRHLFFCGNGTIVLQMALKAYSINGEVITTPFSYVATTNAILWEGATPVFVDIDPNTFCIDPDKIEASITSKTQAILATHVYGYPCNIDKIESIALKHNLKVIYDGAHAFGCHYNGKSLLGYGDISTCSFHATKIFHSVEGGCIITNDDETARKIQLYRQFGHEYDNYYSVGINGKNSEFHAAMGLCVLEDFQSIVESRRKISIQYDEGLKTIGLTRPHFEKSDFNYNYSYYPVLFNSEKELLETRDRLIQSSIYPRRYFYPSLNTLPFIVNRKSCKVSEDISSRILCLPLYHDLSVIQVEEILSLLKHAVSV